MSETSIVDAPSAGKIPDPDNVPVIFISEIAGVGHLNGVINITGATARWTPTEDGSAVHPDRVISVRLRLDLFCAQQLVALLQQQIEANTKKLASTEVN